MNGLLYNGRMRVIVVFSLFFAFVSACSQTALSEPGLTSTAPPSATATETASPSITPTFTATLTPTVMSLTQERLVEFSLVPEGETFMLYAETTAEVLGVGVETLFTVDLAGPDPFMPFGYDTDGVLYEVIDWDFCVAVTWENCGTILLVDQGDMPADLLSVVKIPHLKASILGDTYLAFTNTDDGLEGLDFASYEEMQIALEKFPEALYFGESRSVPPLAGVITIECSALDILSHAPMMGIGPKCK